MSSQIIPFEPEHVVQLPFRSIDLKRVMAIPNGIERIKLLATYATGATLIRDGLILGIMGYYPMWEGVYEVWAFPSVYIEKYPITYLKTAKRYIDLIWDTLKPRRLQTVALADADTRRWMHFLGFEPCGYLGRYSSLGEDFEQWEKVDAYGR